MNLQELEDQLQEILPSGFQVETDNHGQVIIYTGLCVSDDGELEDFEPNEEDFDLEDDEFDGDEKLFDED